MANETPFKKINQDAALQKSAAESLTVEATLDGWYDRRRINKGTIFTLKNQSEFSEKWMKHIKEN